MARLDLSQEELLSLVGQYNDEETVQDHFDFLRDPYLRRYAPPDGPEVAVSRRIEDDRYPLWKDVTQLYTDEEAGIIRELRSAVYKRLRHPHLSSADEVIDIYRKLPERRMSYMNGPLRHHLLRAIGASGEKDTKTMLHYFALVADVKAAGFALTRAEWNMALHLAGRYVARTKAPEVEAALKIWREMELSAATKANEVTFNILFDVASKAGNFTLAEMIYTEMIHRGFRFNRYHSLSLIHFFGLKQDADGVRAAYKEMVQAGELIDSTVLNCVIVGFLRSGEEDAARRVYEAMVERVQREVGTELPIPQRSYGSQKIVTRVLMMFARLSRQSPELRPNFQTSSPMAPDLQTYRILINHYVKLGDIHTVARYLDEMKAMHVPLHGAIFLALFKGFSKHGGSSGSEWSEQRLQAVWAALLQALDGDATGLYIDTWLAMHALRAFERCSTPEMVFKTYNALSVRWDLDEERAEFMIDYLHRVLKHDARYMDLLKTNANRCGSDE